jgi:hypothetical protein
MALSTGPSPAPESQPADPAGESPPCATAPAATAALPPRPIGFTGREEELGRLLNHLAPLHAEASAPPVPVFAITGMGGVGKTALALHAAHTAVGKGWFPGGTLFVDLHGYDDEPVTAERALGALLRRLGSRSERIPAALDELSALYRLALAQRAEDRGAVLVLADNASFPGQVRPLLPGGGPHRLLVTSRDSLPQLDARLLELAELTPSAGRHLVDLALRIADPDDSRAADDTAAAADLAARCGHLPLALRIASALLIADRGKPVAELAAEFRNTCQWLDHLDDGERSVRTTFDLSYRRLPPAQARLLRLLSLAPGPESSDEVVAVLAGEAAPPLRELAGLARAHLVERGSERRRWRLHDLVRTYGASLASGAEAESGRERVLAFYCGRAQAADAWLRWLPGMPVPGRFASRSEALAWLDAERTALLAATQWAEHVRHAHSALQLAECLEMYLEWRLFFGD